MRAIQNEEKTKRIWNAGKKGCLTASAAITLICLGFSMFQPLYLNVDNYQASLVLNQAYDTENYCMFFSPVLSMLSGILHRVLPSADVYTLLSRGLLLLGVWCLGYLIAAASHRPGELLFGHAVLFLLVINASLFFDYFTIWAAFFTCTGMVVLVSALQNKSPVRIAAGTLFAVCGVMWRMESAAIFAPFILLELFVSFAFRIKTKEERQRWVRGLCVVLGPAVLCIILLSVLDRGFRTSEKYRDRVAYTNAVSSVVDYPIEEYDKVADQLPGISRNDYESLRSHLYADTDRIDAAYAERISGAGSKNTGEISLSGILKANRQLLSGILSSKKTMFYILLLFLLLFCLAFSDAVWYDKLELLLACAGGYLVLFCFAFIGRVPLRVINSVLYAVFGIALILHGKGCWSGKKAGLKWGKWITGTAVLLTACMDIVSCDFVRPQSVFHVREGADEEKWSSTYGEGAIYLWKTSEYVLHPMADFIGQGKLMTDIFLEHNLSYGDWVYGQVYYENYLKRLGIPNPMRALVQREKTYYVALDETEALRYLQEHFDDTIEARKVREIEGIPVWEFVSSKEDQKPEE